MWALEMDERSPRLLLCSRRLANGLWSPRARSLRSVVLRQRELGNTVLGRSRAARLLKPASQRRWEQSADRPEMGGAANLLVLWLCDNAAGVLQIGLREDYTACQPCGMRRWRHTFALDGTNQGSPLGHPSRCLPEVPRLAREDRQSPQGAPVTGR